MSNLTSIMLNNKDRVNFMRKIILSTLFLSCSLLQADPFVTTFVNTTNLNLELELRFSDNSTTTKGISMSQSYQVVNFDTKKLISVIFNSSDRDKNGNFYEQLNKNFTAPKATETYNIALQMVPAHDVPASQGTEAFKMPDLQKITCEIAGAPASSNKSSDSKDKSGKKNSATDKSTDKKAATDKSAKDKSGTEKVVDKKVEDSKPAAVTKESEQKGSDKKLEEKTAKKQLKKQLRQLQ